MKLLPLELLDSCATARTFLDMMQMGEVLAFGQFKPIIVALGWCLANLGPPELVAVR